MFDSPNVVGGDLNGYPPALEAQCDMCMSGVKLGGTCGMGFLCGRNLPLKSMIFLTTRRLCLVVKALNLR